MGVYIKGMKMPDLKENQKTKMELFNDNGVMRIGIMTGGYSCCEHWTHYAITEVPEPHGRLIDADALVEMAYEEEKDDVTFSVDSAEELEILFDDDAPTVIEAEGE